MERAVNLKRIRLRGQDECKRCDRFTGQAGAPPLRSASNDEMRNLVREQIFHGLLSPSSIELIIDDRALSEKLQFPIIEI